MVDELKKLRRLIVSVEEVLRESGIVFESFDGNSFRRE